MVESHILAPYLMTIAAYFHKHCHPRRIIEIAYMEPNELQRHRLIKSLAIPPHENAVDAVDAADAAISLWEPMATEIISIVGKEGFNSLYARTIFLNRAAFPWLAASLNTLQADQRLAELKMSFEKQTPAQVGEANNSLLITFTDILASLIGEQLTTRILCLAWNTDISNCTGKESQK
jgi:hypothetical protein